MSTIHALENEIESGLISWIANTAVHAVDMSRFSVRREEQDDSTALTLPAIVLKLERETEDPQPLVGIWRIRATVTMHQQADDTSTAQIEQNWNDLLAVLYWDDLATRLTTSTLKVYAVRYDAAATREHEERHWRHQLSFSLWACAL